MSEVDTGKRLVIQRLEELCREADLTIEGMKWGHSDFDAPPAGEIGKTGPTLYPLAVKISGRQETVRLSDEEFSDLSMRGHVGETARRAIDEKLDALIRRFVPEKRRIGF